MGGIFIVCGRCFDFDKWFLVSVFLVVDDNDWVCNNDVCWLCIC